MHDHDLHARRPVWMALSSLYLDREPDGEHAVVARTLAASPYSLDDLRGILFDEVQPALCANLWSVVGAWWGFDEAWLVARIERRRARPRWLRGVSCVFCGYPRQHWHALRPRVIATRAASALPQAVRA